MPHDLTSMPRSGLARGLELIAAGAYFDAHEALEEEWRTAPAGERDFLQGLVHVTVAWHHARLGNVNGCARQLEKAERRLQRYAPRHRGVDVADVLAQVAAARVRVGERDLALPPPRVGAP